MCNCYPGSYLSSLWLPHYWSWSRGKRGVLLLCQLCGQRRGTRSAGSELKARGKKTRTINTNDNLAPYFICSIKYSNSSGAFLVPPAVAARNKGLCEDTSRSGQGTASPGTPC